MARLTYRNSKINDKGKPTIDHDIAKKHKIKITTSRFSNRRKIARLEIISKRIKDKRLKELIDGQIKLIYEKAEEAKNPKSKELISEIII